jgi:hypothetical protein
VVSKAAALPAREYALTTPAATGIDVMDSRLRGNERNLDCLAIHTYCHVAATLHGKFCSNIAFAWY